MAKKTKKKLKTKAKGPGRPKGTVKKKASKKPKQAVRARTLPDFIKGNYIIVTTDKLNWTPSGWRSISDNVDDPFQFDSRKKAETFIKRHAEDIFEEQAESNVTTAKMNEHYQNNWKVDAFGIITSMIEPIEGNPSSTPIKLHVRNERKAMASKVAVAKASLRDAQKVLDKFNVSMEKYGL